MVVQRELGKKAVALFLSAILVILIFSFLIPPAAGITLTIGGRSPSSTNTGGTITFSDVNISIQNIEHIPIVELNFTIFNNNNNAEVANVRFNVSGNETEDTNSRFGVTLAYPSYSVLQSWYVNTTGYDYGYGYRWGSTEGYGYGYGNATKENITLSYTITYTTHTTGTFYGKIFANATLNDITKIYNSSASATFTVSAPSGGGGGGGITPSPSEEEEEEEEEEETTASDEVTTDIEEQFGINLTVPFYANDTDGDGLLDFFVDPNGVLTNINFVNISGNASFLISTDNDNIPEFFWDTAANSITPVNHAPAAITDTDTDEEQETITVVITVNKTDWIYIDIDDIYPDYTITVKTADGRNISSDMIWRENDKIYILDDPDTQYMIIYSYDLLPPTFNPLSGTTFDTSQPTITITYHETVTITSAFFGIIDITDDLTTTDNQVYTYTPTTGLDNGDYMLTIIAHDTDDNTITSSATYTIEEEIPPPEPEGFPWIIIVIIIVIAIILFIVYLFKIGYLYIEYESPKKKQK